MQGHTSQVFLKQEKRSYYIEKAQRGQLAVAIDAPA
jgi:hypothetical protein